MALVRSLSIVSLIGLTGGAALWLGGTSSSGADSAVPVAVDPLPGKANYFIGNDRSRWRTRVPTYRKVKVPDLYPGVDLVYYGNQRQLEYDFVAAKNQVAVRLGSYDHARALVIDPVLVDAFVSKISSASPASTVSGHRRRS